MQLREIADVVDEYTGRSRAVLEYGMVTKSLVDRAKQPGFTADSWSPLAELVATDEFVRVGNFKEVMNWSEYVDFLTNWASSAQWEGSFKRITETPDLVILELEERSSVGEFSNVVDSVSIYEFDDNGKITHIDVYLQMALPDNAMLGSYEDVRISE
ncbi:hypothetical protein [Rhodococcus sp. (in: high G+C Gram-positive bacteria)]|jgi:hypothetical protein|uniref:hypothetical protein n=1 Tax=unclassified Rhodococcus (in: high G+C Gram-positive bacteria) TaxID=192944 RepID=UPI0019E7DDA8|nr:hypothetical protein [Rhodococcus sp. (in: high G+C Gram-positive bacteria)]MBF0660429.1 hypothetical protein [Rhodococcus sp. (in: high G+C Gram-positive bacteria)]